MKKVTLFIAVMATALLIGILTVPAGAQTPITVQVDRSQLSTDEVLTLKVTIDSSAGQSPSPTLPALDGFELLGSSRATQITVVNGDMSMQAVYSYSLHPTQAGQLVIEPVTVTIDGQIYSTQPIVVEVTQGTGQVQPMPNNPGLPGMPAFPNMPGFPNLNNLFPTMPSNPGTLPNQGPPMNPADAPTDLSGQDFFVEAEVDNANPYQGEQVNYTFRFYQAETLFDQPEYESPAFTGFWSEQQGDSQTDYTLDAAGRAYRVTELQTILFPTVVGEVTIEPAALTIPGDFFTRGMKLQTQPVTLNVRPLPDNAPANFQGAVGQFDIRAQADTTATEVNETVTLQVTLSGQGNLSGVADPQWKEGPEWRAFDSEAAVESEFVDGVLRGMRRYERLLVPTQPGDLLLPAIEYTFFNPESESYETVSTEPIIVNVTGSVAGGVMPRTPDSGAAATVNAAESIPGLPEFRPNKPAAELGHNSGAPLVENSAYWLLWTLPLLFLAGSFGVARYRQRRQETTGLRRSQNAAKRAQSALHEARREPQTQNAAAGRVLNQYLAEKLNINASGMTHATLSATLAAHGIEAPLTERVEACLMTSDMGRYAPTELHFAGGDLLAETEQVITALDQQLQQG